MRIYIGLLVLLVSSCSPYPHKSYYELDEAIRNAETVEEREYYEKRRMNIERTAEKAGEFLIAVRRCQANISCMIQCDLAGVIAPRSPLDLDEWDLSDVEKLVRWYRLVRPPRCGLVHTDML